MGRATTASKMEHNPSQEGHGIQMGAARKKKEVSKQERRQNLREFSEQGVYSDLEHSSSLGHQQEGVIKRSSCPKHKGHCAIEMKLQWHLKSHSCFSY